MKINFVGSLTLRTDFRHIYSLLDTTDSNTRLNFVSCYIYEVFRVNLKGGSDSLEKLSYV